MDVVQNDGIMGLNIKNEEAHGPAQELAEVTCENLTAAVTEALRERLLRIDPQARVAHEAYRGFGIGGGHAAQLNFGGCFAYALAEATGEPLLLKGNHFTHTAVTSALA